jgi:hypothetical protein
MSWRDRVSFSCPRAGGADVERYNYGEFVSRIKEAYSGMSLLSISCGVLQTNEIAGCRFRRT